MTPGSSNGNGSAVNNGSSTWLGCEVVGLDTSAIVLQVSDAGVVPVICVDVEGNVRATHNLVISRRKGVSLI